MDVSVIIPTHNPRPDPLRRVLQALAAQTLPRDRWELVVVDNASTPAVATADLAALAPVSLRVVAEPEPGLTAARRRGLRSTQGDAVVFVDDDNVLAPDFLTEVVRVLAAEPRVGAAGGPSRPEFASPPPAWLREFDSLLACRDLGPDAQVSRGPHSGNLRYPPFAPIGAGLVLRRAAARVWLEAPAEGRPTDRRGTELTSGGDNDIILTVLAAGWEVAYFPTLALTHLIPSERLQPDYLARLNRAIARSWVQVLARHGACPWPAIAPWTVPLRQLKSWFLRRPWSGPAARIRWQGACGHFEGLASLPRP